MIHHLRDMIEQQYHWKRRQMVDGINSHISSPYVYNQNNKKFVAFNDSLIKIREEYNEKNRNDN